LIPYAFATILLLSGHILFILWSENSYLLIWFKSRSNKASCHSDLRYRVHIPPPPLYFTILNILHYFTNTQITAYREMFIIYFLLLFHYYYCHYLITTYLYSIYLSHRRCWRELCGQSPPNNSVLYSIFFFISMSWRHFVFYYNYGNFIFTESNTDRE